MDKYNDILQEAIDERIDAFIRGVMTEEEETTFKQEIQADPELRSQVLATLALVKGIRTQEAEKEKYLIDNNESMVAEASQIPSFKIPSGRVRSIMLWACSIAALFVVIFLSFPMMNSQDDLSPYYSEYSINASPRGDVDSVTVAHLYTLFNNIQTQRNVSDIIKELEPIYATLDTDFTYSAYANDIALNLALAYIKNDQIEKAIPILKKLEMDNPDTPIASKAKSLVKKLAQ